MKAATSNAADLFTQMVQADREKKKHEALAQQIFGRKTATSHARAATRTGPSASLASRVGVTKRSSSTTSKPSIDGKWGHDLHDSSNGRLSRPSQLSRTNTPSQIDRGNRLYASLQKETGTNGTASQFNVRSQPSSVSMSIKGMAASGPYVVIASNFAPGTTAADIEAAMAPVGGEVSSCHLLSNSPTVMCEIVFVAKEGAENVIATFNNQKADGRLLYVYMKQGGPSPMIHKAAQPAVPSGPRAREPAPPEPLAQPAPPPAPALRDERDVMDIDETQPAKEDSQASRERQPVSRDINMRDDRRDGSGYRDGRYSYSNSYDGRERRDYRRDQAPPYGGNGYRGGDRRYRR